MFCWVIIDSLEVVLKYYLSIGIITSLIYQRGIMGLIPRNVFDIYYRISRYHKILCTKPLKSFIYLYCLIIRRWHKINIPDTSRPSAMTHRDDEKKEAVSEAVSFLYPVMKYALLLLHQLHIRESGRIPFLTIWHTSTHIKKLLM